MASKDKPSKLAAALSGVYRGAWQQPRDVIGAAIASQLSDDLSFQDALAIGNEMALSGDVGRAKEAHPGYFGGGEVLGNVALTALPAAKLTGAIGKAAPALNKAPLLGKALSGTAKAIGAGRGVVGVPAAGAIQGAVSTLASDGDLSGAGGGALGNSVFGLGGKLIRPFADNIGSAAKQGFTKTLEKIGIDDLTIGQRTGNKGFELVDSVLGNLPFTAGKAKERAEGQLRKFTAAALEKAGIVGDDFSPAVREAAERQFNQRYTDLIKNTTVKLDDPVIEKVGEIMAKQLDKLPTNTKPVIQSYLSDIVQAGGSLSGEAYQAARSQLTQQARSLGQSDPFTAGVLKEIRNTLDSAAERSLPEARKGAWREVNRQYGNYKTLQKAGSRVSSDSLEGLISPSALLSTVETANKTKGQAGYGDLYELARAGRSSLVDSVPNSGTAQRQLLQNLLTGGGIGGITYGVTQNPETALAAGVGTVALPKAVQSIVNSKAGKQYLTEGIPGLNKLIGAGGAAIPTASAQLMRPDEQLQPMQDLPPGFIIQDQQQQPAQQLPPGFVLQGVR